MGVDVLGGGFMFSMPDIPGVMADGATELEAIAEGLGRCNAVRLWHTGEDR
jgi:hypothetical protein